MTLIVAIFGEGPSCIHVKEATSQISSWLFDVRFASICTGTGPIPAHSAPRPSNACMKTAGSRPSQAATSTIEGGGRCMACDWGTIC